MQRHRPNPVLSHARGVACAAAVAADAPTRRGLPPVGTARWPLLRRHFLLSALTAEDFERLVASATERSFGHGQTIFRRGDPGSSLLAVLEGQVRIGVCSESGKEITLGIVGQGELFGEIAVIDGAGRTADATAIGSCRLLVLDRRDFLPFLERCPGVAVRLLQLLCARMRKATSVCESVALLDVPMRLARLLLQLAEEHGEPAGSRQRIALKLSQQELGNLVAATRESINKHLRLWEAEGLISTSRGCIVLNDVARIELLGGGAE
jgi:CRP/FNR family transcriptional regulator, cyclic AMP receptor protein